MSLIGRYKCQHGSVEPLTCRRCNTSAILVVKDELSDYEQQIRDDQTGIIFEMLNNYVYDNQIQFDVNAFYESKLKEKK